MSKRRKIIVIARQREYDEERWKHFITALAYALHERHKAEESQPAEPRQAGEGAES